MLFSLPATVIYGSVKDEFGNINIASNLVNSLPNNSVWGVCINLLMWASCICSLPVLLSSTSELLEKNCPDAGTAFFVHDKKRLGIRFSSNRHPHHHCLSRSLLWRDCQHLYPFWLIEIESFILLGGFAFGSYINFDSCDHPLLCVQIYYGTETTVDSFRFRVCCLRSDGSSHILLCSSSRKELDKSLNPYL